MAYAGAYAVIARIAAAYYYNVLTICGYKARLKLIIKQRLCGGLKKINRKVNPLNIAVFGFKVARITRTAAKHHRVIGL